MSPETRSILRHNTYNRQGTAFSENALDAGGPSTYSVSVGLIYKRIWVIGQKGRRKVEALFDTGSSDSLLHERIARAIGDPEGLPEPKTYAAVVGTMTAREGIFADILLRGKRLTAGLMVVHDLSEDLILGADFFQRWHVRLEPKHHRVILDPKALRLRAGGGRLMLR